MQKLLLDTHIWLWYAFGDEKLPLKSKKLIENEKNAIYLSSISIWECLLLHEKKRINIGSYPNKWIEDSLRKFPVIEIPISFEVALKSRSIDIETSDPADRFILASALINSCILITEDRVLKEQEIVNTI